MATIRYLKITDVDDTRFILRITRESPDFIHGFEVNAEGDEVVPTGYERRHRTIARALVKQVVPMRMNPKYATLEVVPREDLAEKTHAHARRRDPDVGAAEGAVTEGVCTVTRSKLYPTPGRSYRFAWKWLYTVAIPGEPYTFDGDTLSWVRALCKRKSPGMPIGYAWKEEAASEPKKTPMQLDAEIAAALGKRGPR